MGFKITENGNKSTYGKVSYIADTVADVAKLPTSDEVGSTCLVIENSSVYILNTKKEWKEI